MARGLKEHSSSTQYVSLSGSGSCFRTHWYINKRLVIQDWALFQTSDPLKDNYVSAEHVPGELFPNQTPSTVQKLSVRFDQKGHERPFQKAIIIDIVDGYINPGDMIIVRMGDRRLGARGTRVQTFVEDKFLMRWYIDPVGTSRFAPIKPDISINIHSGEVASLKVVSPRLVRPGESFPIYSHAEDIWGNATTGVKGLRLKLCIYRESKDSVPAIQAESDLADFGWSYAHFPSLSLDTVGDYRIEAMLLSETQKINISAIEYLTVGDSPVPRVLFGDLHVHSDDTVGTNDSKYNFSYAQKIAGLDVVGYTANDFNITASKWESTFKLIKEINKAGEFVVFPGTEWCGNSAVGGDHNVVFLDDPETHPPEFPVDKNGNVARSFEWNEDGPAELQPGAWPLDEVYATYAHASSTHLMIPHVGGRRCNLSWHHPQLERLVEIGSAWGLFEWLIQDSVARGWKMGVCANSDEHRGRCGGGVPGTAVFGTKGGITGILSDNLDRKSVAEALRARHTFATTGERLVALVSTNNGAMQGDEVSLPTDQALELNYAFHGSSGFSSIEAFDASGRIFHRDLWTEHKEPSSQSVLRVTWGGARLYDRYREAVWDGEITTTVTSPIERIHPFGGVSYVPEERIHQVDDYRVAFSTRTSGDFDGVNIYFSDNYIPEEISIRGTLGGYVKVGDPTLGNPHKPQPTFEAVVKKEQAALPGGYFISIKGGADLFLRIEIVPDINLPKRVEGSLKIAGSRTELERSIYFVGREWNGGKVITSPVFASWRV
jgi:hypothetical protein